jgi:predicted amidohydrolase
MNNLRAAAVQFQHAPGDKSANLATIESFARQAAEQQAELIVFPECCVTGYWHLRKLERSALEHLAEPVPAGPTTQRLLELAAELKMTIGAGMIESLEGQALQQLRGGDVKWAICLPSQVTRVCQPSLDLWRSVHGLRYAPWLPHGRADLLRQQFD